MNRGILTVSCLALAFALTACGEEHPPGPNPDEPKASGCELRNDRPLAIAVGARANVPRPELSKEVTELTERVVTEREQLTMIRIDGTPKIIFDEPPPPRGGSPTGDKKLVDDYLAVARKAFSDKTTAQVPQADVLRALSLAGDATARGGTIVLLDSGLQTVDPVNFTTDGFLLSDPAEVVGHLKNAERNLLPDLAGRTVVLSGFAKVASPQPTLDDDLSRRVRAIWRAIAEAAGACVNEEPLSTTDDSAKNVPPVALVPLPAPPPPKPSCEPFVLTERQVSFIPDTAQFRQPDAARAAVQPLVEAMRDGRQRVELVGSTASSGSVAGRQALSEQRAAAVKTMLVELGADSNRITTRGVGSSGPDHVPDVGPRGELLPGPAALNRKVVVNVSCPGRG
ncbi:OmpA family protein [Kibdelosporangium aridum]|nr:OmpA family protein [Kibdelosporangium aridum]